MFAVLFAVAYAFGRTGAVGVAGTRLTNTPRHYHPDLTLKFTLRVTPLSATPKHAAESSLTPKPTTKPTMYAC